jgi:hypothetical protein
LVHWGEYKNEIDKIINIKKTSTPLIIYSPQGTDKINQDSLEKINNEPNSVIAFFLYIFARQFLELYMCLGQIRY